MRILVLTMLASLMALPALAQSPFTLKAPSTSPGSPAITSVGQVNPQGMSKVDVMGGSAGATMSPAGPGSIARTIEGHFADVVNVKDYGADPTGVGDSTSAFAAAQAAILASPIGGQLTIPPGTYSLINAPSFILSGNQAETIMGGGRRATTLLISGSGFNATLTGTGTGFSVRRMSIVHTGSRGGTAVTATRTVSPSVGGTDDFSELMVSGVTPSTSFQNGIVTTGEDGATFDDDQIVLPSDASTSMTMGHGVEINGTGSTLYAIDNKFQNDVFDGGTAGIYVGSYVQGFFGATVKRSELITGSTGPHRQGSTIPSF